MILQGLYIVIEPRASKAARRDCGIVRTRDMPPGSLNKAERLEWFRDQGFGMFIHWSVDRQTGVVISHSFAGVASASR